LKQQQHGAKERTPTTHPTEEDLKQQEASLRELAEDLKNKFTFILGAA
jgi:hypothetical protein